MKIATLLFSLTILVPSAHAWRESHGGDSIAADFIGRTNDYIRQQGFNKRDDVTNNIMVVTKDRLFNEENQEIPISTNCERQNAEDDIKCTITINRLQYLALEKNYGQDSKVKKEALILDEIIKIIEISKNEIFSKTPKSDETTRSASPPRQTKTTKDFIDTMTWMLEDLSLSSDPSIKIIYQKILNALPAIGYLSEERVVLNGVEKDAINTCLTLATKNIPCVIIISTPRWAQYDSQFTDQAERKKEQLILHEFLGIIKENDKDYSLSEKIVNNLSEIRGQK